MSRNLAAGHSQAVLVGVNSYKANWSPLRFAENDVNGLATTLQVECGWEPTEIHTWVGSRARRRTVESALKDVLQGSRPDELIIVYLSTHAMLNTRNELYLALWDTSPDALNRSGIASGDLLDWIDTSPAGQVVLLLDCCYSGAVGVGRDQLPEYWHRSWDIEKRTARLAKGAGRAVIASSWDDEPSMERQYGATGFGIFTHYLLEGLRGGGEQRLAVSPFGEVDAGSLSSYIQRQPGLGQTPFFRSRGVFPVLVRRTEWMGEGAMSDQDTSVHSHADQVPVTKLMWRRSDSTYKFNGFDLAPSGEFSMVTFEDGSVVVVTGAAARDLRPVVTANDWPANRVLIAPSSSLALLATRERKADAYGLSAINLVSLDGASVPMRKLFTSTAPFSKIAFSSSGQLVAAARAGEIRVWDTNGREVAQLMRDEFAGRMVNDFAFCLSDGKKLAVAFARQAQLHLWDVNLESREPGSSKSVKSLTRDNWAANDECLLLAVSPNGNTIACVTTLGNIFIWNAQNGSALPTQAKVPNVPSTLAFNASSDMLACGTMAGEVHVFRAPNLELTAVVPFSLRVSSLTYSPDSSTNLVAAADASGAVKLWDSVTGAEYSIDRPSVGGDTFIRFSRDGTRLLVANRTAGMLEAWRLDWVPARR